MEPFTLAETTRSCSYIAPPHVLSLYSCSSPELFLPRTVPPLFTVFRCCIAHTFQILHVAYERMYLVSN